ncbi:MAG: mannose-6-phosphate isomerase [Lutibacter sp.]|uniref:class I mannose-6-phosphate isomerase n=1 Tax=Lutibacter sp. TaxID=1925666 RepID=UPI0019E8CF8E|nr:class I mannose-6-phosphate isomerase [Lutibacter sp.]NOR27731.1 mannose-6-phosphate isomerase [Lutibacter sp.]
MSTKFNKFPTVKMPSESTCYSNWDSICNQITEDLNKIQKSKKVVVVEFYHGVNENEFKKELNARINTTKFIEAKSALLSEEKIKQLVFPDVTDDRIFGYMSRLNLENFFNNEKIVQLNTEIENTNEGVILVTGIGASIVCKDWDILVYADMARWEIQQRMRRFEVDNLGVNNKDSEFNYLYKQAYFVDWRACDKHKKKLFEKIDYILDSNTAESPKMIHGKTYLDGLSQTNKQPFSVVPFFDPGVWGGQWMKEVCDLDKSAPNYAWCFNCVPEENSLLFQFGDILFETPSINLVFYEPEKLLGEAVYSRFGDEFPIRFDFLDTMGGGNLSLQVHPLTEYIQEKFGVNYTQDESYYMLDVEDDAVVYLGTKEDTNPSEVIKDLKIAEKGKIPFNADKHIEAFPVKKHDHILIPAGTIHCSGSGSMVLEVSATPYIFTFKLWDWGRLGMDGKPRPINIEHGEKVIDWSRTTSWTKENLINRVEKVDEGNGWIEEKTGLHEREFIETRRHWFTNTVSHNTNGGVNVICLIEGEQAIVESPTNSFESFTVSYAETFIIPATIGNYTIRPYGNSIGKEIGTLKAYVRT